MTRQKDERDKFMPDMLDINTIGEHFCIISDEGAEFSAIPIKKGDTEMVSLFMTDGTNMVSYELPKTDIVMLLKKLTKTVN